MKFLDFWAGFDPSEQWFFDRIRDRRGSACFSVFGDEHRSAASESLLFYTAEVRPDNRDRAGRADFSASFHDWDGGSHLRLPNYVCIHGPERVKEDVRNRHSEPVGDRPACMVASNGDAEARKDLVRALQEEVGVDCGGPVLNNVPRVPKGDGARERDRNFHDFARDYRFVVAAENRKRRGYTTEKLFNAFRAGAVPIYYGNPDADDFFNRDAVVHCDDFDSFGAVAERVRDLLDHPDAYENKRRQPALPDSDIYSEEKIDDFVSCL